MADEQDHAPLKISRKDLYELVWSKPIQELAMDFGISGVALAKRCRRLGVPVPGRGYWARVDAGQTPHRPALPERETDWRDQKLLTVTGPTEEPASPAMPGELTQDWDAIDAAWLKERLAEEARPESTVRVPRRMHRWHPTLATLRDELEIAAQKLRESKAAWERFQKLPEWRKQRSHDDKGWAWSSVRRDGQRVADTVRATPFRVSLGTYERALRLANVVALALTDRGFSVERDVSAGRIVATLHDARVEFRITELLNDTTRPTVRYDGKMEQERYKEPTGRLRLTLSTDRTEGPVFEDGPSELLEDQLGRAICAIYRRIVRARRAERERNAAHARWEEARRRAEEQARMLAAQEAARAAERARRRRLSIEATRWMQAQKIRDYVAHLQSKSGKQQIEAGGFSDWLAWALQVADEMDPTERRLTR